MCLAVPVRDAVQRGRETDGGSRAGSIIGRSVPPSRAASVQGELTVVASHSGLPTGPQGTARPSSPVDTLAASAPAHMAGGGGHAPSDPATASTASSNGAGTATPAVGGRTSLAISPRVSVLGGSLAGSSYADAATAFLPGGNRSDTPQGVEFVHAATAAAASAWHLGELRVGSPAPPSAVLASSGSGGRPPRPLAQQVRQRCRETDDVCGSSLQLGGDKRDERASAHAAVRCCTCFCGQMLLRKETARICGVFLFTSAPPSPLHAHTHSTAHNPYPSLAACICANTLVGDYFRTQRRHP